MHGNSYCSLKAPSHFVSPMEFSLPSHHKDSIGFGPKFRGTDGKPTLDPANQHHRNRTGNVEDHPGVVGRESCRGRVLFNVLVYDESGLVPLGL
jgi:hypothetical protein